MTIPGETIAKFLDDLYVYPVGRPIEPEEDDEQFLTQ
jgi:hypothetical protein